MLRTLNAAFRHGGGRLLRDRNGAIAVQFALAMLPIIALVGFGVDYGRATRAKGVLQESLDAAVLAGATDGTAAWLTTAQDVFDANAASVEPVQPSFQRGDDGSVSGSLSATVTAQIVNIIGIDVIPVTADSTALLTRTTDKSCILALGDGTETSDAMRFNGAPNVSFGECTIRSNTSMRCNGHSGGSIASIAVGTVDGCSNPQPDAAPVPDIYATKADGISKLCGTSRPGATWTPGSPPPGAKVVAQGNYTEYHICGNLTLSGNGYLTGSAPAADTVIVVENGNLIMANNAAVTTRRVAIVLTGNNSYPSSITFPNGNGKAATLSLSPPTTRGNPWRGIALFQDPILTDTDHDWGPGATFNADGVVYMPNSDLLLRGSSASEASGCTKMVVKSLQTNGSVNLHYTQLASGCASLGVSQWESAGTAYLSR
jgi:Flp pilus assembly protein TadG